MKFLIVAMGLLFPLFYPPTVCAQGKVEVLLSQAKAGDKDAQRELGISYFEKKAALAVFGSAQLFTGESYAKGEGITQNSAQAAAWLAIAAEKDEPDGLIASRKNAVLEKLSPEQKKEVDSLILQHRQTIEQHNAQDVTRDYASTVKWFKKVVKGMLRRNAISYMAML